MSLSLSLGIIGLLLVLVGQFFVTAMYYAVLNARRKLLREKLEAGYPRARQTLRLSENTKGLLTTQPYVNILLTSLAAVIWLISLVSALGEALISAGASAQWADELAFVLLLLPFTLSVIFIGHFLPIAIVSGREEGFALFATPSLKLILNIFTPITSAVEAVSSRSGRLLGGAGKATLLIEEEIKTLVDAGSVAGTIEVEEKEMIYSVLRFSETTVREVMVPRVNIIALEIDTPLDQALDKIVKAGHSRIPVYEDSIDHVKGFLYAKDLLGLWRNKPSEQNIVDLLRDPYFVPEDKSADELLEEFQNRETHIAIVTDDYGGTAGLVTIEDLLEEIVGEIRDEYDFLEEEPYEQISELEYICLAGLDLDDLNDLLDVSLPTDENDTLGGLIFSELEKVPQLGDVVQIANLRMEVVKVKGRRLEKIRVTKLPSETDYAPLSESETSNGK